MKSKWLTLCLFLLSVVVHLPTAQADLFVAYSSLGSNDEFNTSGYAVGNQVDPLNYHLAYKFTSEEQGYLHSVEVATELLRDDAPDAMELSLWSHSLTTGNPATLLWSGTVSPAATAAVVSAGGGLNAPWLQVDQDYWISARSGNGSNYYGWRRTTIGTTNQYRHDFSGGTSWSSGGNQLLPAFRINVSEAAVPEPGTGILALATLPLVALARRNRSSGKPS